MGNFGMLKNPLISAIECSMNSSDLLTDVMEPYKSFSNYSMVLGYAAELDFWDPEVIPEDFHMVYKAMMCSHGADSVCRVWSVIANDSVTAFRDRYIQAKRHMWGVTTIAWIMAIVRHAPFAVDRIWYHPLKMYAAEMSESLAPSWISTVVLGLDAWYNHANDANTADALRLLGVIAIGRWLLGWLVFYLGEALVWKRMMESFHRDLEKPSWRLVLWHYALMPVTSPIADFIFGNLACWHAVYTAFWSSEFEYICAPKA